MKFFVTGVNGQLGHDVMKELSHAVTRESDLTLLQNIPGFRMILL